MTATDLILLIIGILVALAVGSFLCVVVDRLPVGLDEPNEVGDLYDTRPWAEVLSGTSHCGTCGSSIRWYDKVPVLSWVILRGRCRSCGATIPAFHPVIELALPFLFLVMVWSIGWSWRLVPALALLPGAVVISAIDVRTLIVPTRVVWPTFLFVVLWSIAATLAIGQPEWLLVSFIGLVSLAGPLFALWFILPSGMGFGDVRLAVLLGWTVGFYAGTTPIAGVILAIVTLFVASIVGLVLGILVLGARGRKAKVPFGPALVAAALTCIAMAQPILEPFGAYSLG